MMCFGNCPAHDWGMAVQYHLEGPCYSVHQNNTDDQLPLLRMGNDFFSRSYNCLHFWIFKQ